MYYLKNKILLLMFSFSFVMNHNEKMSFSTVTSIGSNSTDEKIL